MRTLHSLSITSGVALLLGSTATFADVTAAQVWQDWQDNMGLYGPEVTIGSETVDGGTITITDLGVVIDDEQGTVVETSLPMITFAEQGDGTVLVTTAETTTFKVTDTSEWFPEEPSVLAGSLTHDGMQITVSGDEAELVYEIEAASYGVSIDEFTDFGETIPMDAMMTLNDLAGTYTVQPGDLRNITYDVTAASTDLVMKVVEDGLTMLDFTGSIADLALAAEIAVPEGLSFDDPEQMDLAGLLVDAGYTFGTVAYAFEFNDGFDSGAGSISAASGMLDILFSEDNVAYDTSVSDMAFNMTVPDFPFPINVTAAEYGITFGMPLSRTDGPEDFVAAINLTEIAVNDELWMLADPAGQLPHDAVTAQIGLSGTARWLFDLLDPEQQMEMARADMPIEPYSVQIDTLNIDAIGLVVTGEGGFTFDNSDLSTIPGVPRPEGSVTVNAEGVNSLLDTLVNMGLVPAEEIMGVRMMMGMFATSTGNDSLSSTLEINAQGHIIVNGQRMQ